MKRRARRTSRRSGTAGNGSGFFPAAPDAAMERWLLRALPLV